MVFLASKFMTPIFLTAQVNVKYLLERITNSEYIHSYNGKEYINLTIGALREVDNHGNTHILSISPSKEERARGKKAVSVCGLKEWETSNYGSRDARQKNDKQIQIEDLPF